MGEFLALAVSLEHLADTYNNSKAKVLADTLDEATARFLENDKSPSRKAGELDNRGSHYYLALYWAQALAEQSEDEELKNIFGAVAREMENQEKTIVQELITIQGHPVDIGGYYRPDEEKTENAMRPSGTLNMLLDGISAKV